MYSRTILPSLALYVFFENETLSRLNQRYRFVAGGREIPVSYAQRR